MELHAIGSDLGNTVFHLAGLNLRGEVVVRMKFSRRQVLQFTASLHVELIGMKARGGAHFLGQALREQGHEVRLMPAHYVKPYVKTNESDFPYACYFPSGNLFTRDLLIGDVRLRNWGSVASGTPLLDYGVRTPTSLPEIGSGRESQCHSKRQDRLRGVKHFIHQTVHKKNRESQKAGERCHV